MLPVIAFALIAVSVTTLCFLLDRWPQPQLDKDAVLKLAKEYSDRNGFCKEGERLFSHIENRNVPLKDVVILITGPTSGIGNCLTKILHNMGATIIAIGRSQNRLDNLKSELDDIKAEKSAESRIHRFVADFADLESVANASDEVLTKFTHVDFFINNAGIPNVPQVNGKVQRTRQGFELVFGVNYLAHFLLTEKLLPLLQNSKKEPRIIYITSNFHRGVDGSGLHTEKGTTPPIASGLQSLEPRPMHAYATSKFAQILHMRSINRRQQKHQRQLKMNEDYDTVAVNMVRTFCVCPAAVRTTIHKGSKKVISSMSFPVDVSTTVIFNAMFLPFNEMDYLKNIPTLRIMKPPLFMSDTIRMVYLFVTCVITMPIQKMLFREYYGEKSSCHTYDESLQKDFYKWSLNEVKEWM